MTSMTKALVLTIFHFLPLFPSSQTLPCILRGYPYGLVCVCNVTYCDTLDNISPEGPNGFILVSSSEGGLRFSVTKDTFDQSRQYHIQDYNHKNDAPSLPPLSPLPLSPSFNSVKSVLLRVKRFFGYKEDDINADITSKTVELKIDRSVKYQKVVGFGGALTGSVSYLFDNIPEFLRHNIYQSYFSKTVGIAYNLLRIPIGGCDFDLSPWAYNESPINDKNLSNFTKLDIRDELKVQQIKEIMNVTNNYNIKLFGSAWSPPKWMKSNNDWTGRSDLKPEYYQTWANYHLKFLKLMMAKNTSIWAISTGNEPLNGVIGWLFVRFMSLGWTPLNQGKWVSENLGPTIKNSAFKNVKIFGNDDQRYTFPVWFERMDEGDRNSMKYLDGLAVHWYWDKVFGAHLLDKAHELYSDKIILNTESCVGDKPWEHHGPEFGSWKRAEKYITSYMEDFQHWVNGWIDWNLILNEEGGPNYVKNFVDAPIVLNMTNKNEFYKQPIFYAIGHFSKFIPENSVRIYSKSQDLQVNLISFERPDGRISTIFYNSKKIPINLVIADSYHGNIVVTIPPKSLHTIIYN